jgi:hypothetical protein
MPHYFSREEAEALLPQISRILRQLQVSYRELRQTEELLHGLHMQAKGNGHDLNDRIFTLQQAMTVQRERLSQLIGEVEELGCEIKDLDMGLIDFLSLRHGEEVYLCWRLGEDEHHINFWHYLDTGFAGRQPL